VAVFPIRIFACTSMSGAASDATATPASRIAQGFVTEELAGARVEAFEVWVVVRVDDLEGRCLQPCLGGGPAYACDGIV